MRTFLKRVRIALSIGFGLALAAGCSGGGGSGPPVPAPAGADRALSQQSIRTQSASAGNVTFTIGVTPKKPASHVGPNYISPSTESLQILVDGANGVIVDLTPSSPNCSPNPTVPGSYVCTASLTVPGGNHVFTVTAYDAPGAKGNILSKNSTGVVYVKPVGSTVVSIVLQGIVQYINLSLANPKPPAGKSLAISLNVVVQDADHNTIVGPALYEEPITLTTSDSKAGPLSKTLLKSPADTGGITANYNGASIPRITYSANAAGVPAANVMNAVLVPQSGPPPAATGTGSLATLDVGGTTYTFVPTSSMSFPTSGGLIEVPTFTGGGIATSSAGHRNMELAPLTNPTAKMLKATGGRAPMVRVNPDFANPTVGGNTAGITACSSDHSRLRLYCINSASSTITVVDGSKVPATVSKTITTDAGGYVRFSGGSCIICGVVYDPLDDAAIISTGHGIEVYSSAGAHVATIAANPSETFGYNPLTDQVFNPEYSYAGGAPGLPTPSLDVIDIKTATRFTLAKNPSGLLLPDQGAVDSNTNLGISFEEGGSQYYLVPMGSGTYNAANHSFTLPGQVGFPITSSANIGCDFADGIAVDSQIDTAFFNAEFCTIGVVGAGQLPRSATPSPTVSSFAFAFVPKTPDGANFASGFDPHSQTVVSSSAGDYGITSNGQLTYLAIVDLKKLLAAPRSPTDPTVVDPTYNLLTNKVITFIPI